MSKRHRFGTWWRKWAGSIAFGALIIAGAAGLQRQQAVLYHVCQNDNAVRLGLRQYFKGQIIQMEHTNFAQVFPGVPKATLEELLKQSEARLRYDVVVRFKDSDCNKLYPRTI